MSTFAQGAHGLTTVYLKGTLVGTLTDGEVGALKIVRKDTFNLHPYLGSVTGHDTLTFDLAPRTLITDGWALDYAEPPAVPAVPEPASLLLFGAGLVGLRAWRKRR